jgi:2-dehydropantoate 2-reductase
MKVLIYGAGVLGSVYAGRLHHAGNDVAILARGERFALLRKHGLILQEALTGETTYCYIPITEVIESSEEFDLVIVTVRKNQVPDVLPVLGNRNLGNILFMVNNPSGYQQWIDAVGRERLLVGFPGAGGILEGDVVRYHIAPRWLQPTTLGELDGRITRRLKEIASVFRHAGFPVATSRNMDAWQKTHVAVVSPVANAIYMAGGSGTRLAQTPDAAQLAIRAIREGFAVLKALNVPITPAKLRLFGCLPRSVLASILCAWAKTGQFETVAVKHANVATDEMRTLAEEFKELASKTSVLTPAIDKLRTFIPMAAYPRASATTA